MNKFKPGDVVKCVYNNGVQDDLKTGWLYTVSTVADNLLIEPSANLTPMEVLIYADLNLSSVVIGRHQKQTK